MITREATVWLKSANPLSKPYVGLVLPPELEGGESDTVTFWGEEFRDFNLGDRVNVTFEKIDVLAGMPGIASQSFEQFSRDCDRLDGRH